MTYGNYDAGKVSGPTNPFIHRFAKVAPQPKYVIKDVVPNQGVSMNANPWGMDLSNGVTPEKRIGENTNEFGAALEALNDAGENDRFVDKMLAQHIRFPVNIPSASLHAMEAITLLDQFMG